MNAYLAFIPSFLIYYAIILIHLRNDKKFRTVRKRITIGVKLFVLFGIQAAILLLVKDGIDPEVVFAITLSNIVLIIGFDMFFSLFHFSLFIALSNFILSEKRKFKTVSKIISDSREQ